MTSVKKMSLILASASTLVTCSPPAGNMDTPRTIAPPPRNYIKFEFDHSGRDYAFGIAVQTENRTTIYGFSSSEGFERFSYRIDEQGRAIADSGLEFSKLKP